MAQNKKIGFEIRSLHAQLKTVSEIAKETKLSEKEVVKYLEEHCLKPIYERKVPPHEWASEPVKIDSKSPPLITTEDMYKVAELYNKGIAYLEMATILKITYNRLTSIVKKARRKGLIGKRLGLQKGPEVKPEETEEEFCCEVTPETDMDEYMKDRENLIPTKKPLPDIVIESIKGMKDILEAKIEDAEYTIKYCKEQLNELEEFMKENEVCQK